MSLPQRVFDVLMPAAERVNVPHRRLVGLVAGEAFDGVDGRACPSEPGEVTVAQAVEGVVVLPPRICLSSDF
jgi:hypothetical protein